MNIDEPVWNHSTFSANRERLFNDCMAQRFFQQVLRVVEWQELISDEHFKVDGTRIKAWASMKSFVKKDGSGLPLNHGGRNPTAHFKGEKRGNAMHQSTTDPDARLYKGKTVGGAAAFSKRGPNGERVYISASAFSMILPPLQGFCGMGTARA